MARGGGGGGGMYDNLGQLLSRSLFGLRDGLYSVMAPLVQRLPSITMPGRSTVVLWLFMVTLVVMWIFSFSAVVYNMLRTFVCFVVYPFGTAVLWACLNITLSIVPVRICAVSARLIELCMDRGWLERNAISAQGGGANNV